MFKSHNNDTEANEAASFRSLCLSVIIVKNMHASNGHETAEHIKKRLTSSATVRWRDVIKIILLITTVVSMTAGTIVWMQTQNDRSYATKVELERQTTQVEELKQGVSELQRQNTDILRSLGRIEGKIQ